MDDIENAIVHNTLSPPWTSIPSSATSAYSNITANDNSRVHNGHNFYFHQYYTVQNSGNDFAERSLQATLKRKRSLADIDANPRTRAAQESLDTVLKKLGKLSLSVRHRKEGDAAEKIARRIAAVFDAITTQDDAETWDKTAARHLGKLRATVKWEEVFDINSLPRRGPIGRNAKAKTRRISVQISHWNISLTTAMFDSRLDGGLHEMEIFSTLRVEPRYQSSRPALAVCFSEYRDSQSTRTIPPTVLAYNMVEDSEVFQIVIEDDLDGLLRLLACGEASIRDCDTSGRSLLHYACCGNSRKCCSYLLSQGVDTDRFEMSFDYIFDPASSGLQRPRYESPIQYSIRQTIRIRTCFDILWHAGADPTATADPIEEPSPLLSILELGHAARIILPSLLACLKEGSPYIDFQERFESESCRGYWLTLCQGQAVLKEPSILQAFADKGVDIRETDRHGFNCLFVFMARVDSPKSEHELTALLCLLAIFDDIYALDATGNDIFAYINELRAWPGTYAASAFDCGSYKQDLWYCALARKKLDITHNIRPSKRLARYTPYYTPKHYLALCHLDHWNSWDEEFFETQIQLVLQEHPLSEAERLTQQELEPLWEPESESDSSSEERIQQETKIQSEWESDSDFSSERDDGSV